jgi:GNAT superfamily N-acetyltransferase
MSRQGFQVREYGPQDEAAVLALLRQSLGDGRAFDRTSAFWHWKHTQNPFGPSLMLVAANGHILGLRAFMRWRFRSGERLTPAVRAVDTATHPGARRQGVFAHLTRLAIERAKDEGVALIFNTPNQRSLPGYLKLGWTYVGRVPVLVKLLRPWRVLRRLVGRRATPDAALLPVVDAEPAGAALSRPVLASLLEASERLTRCGIRTDRTMSFLQWRYGAVPSLHYYVYWKASDPHAGVTILRPNQRSGLREVMICELLLGTAEVGRTLEVLRGLTVAVEADYLVAHAARRSLTYRALRRAGFVPVSRLGPHLVVRTLAPEAASISPASAASWDLSLGDLEVF